MTNEEKKESAEEQSADTQKTEEVKPVETIPETAASDTEKTEEGKAAETAPETQPAEAEKTEEMKAAEAAPAADAAKPEAAKAAEGKALPQKPAPEMAGPGPAGPDGPRPPHGPEPVNAPKKHHHFRWDIFGKVCAVCLLAFACGFGGGYVAYKVTQDEEDDRVTEFSQGPAMQAPSQNDGSGSSSSGEDSPFSSGAVLGITVQQKASSSDSTDTQVVIVAINDKGNADDAGLQVGDVITKIDDTDVTSVSDLSEYVSSLDVGDTVTITYERDGEESTADVELVDSATTSDSSNAA
jgi:hypothetical protein